MAKATKNSIIRHLWYLSQELSILGLFDSEVSEEDKVQMAQALVGCPRPEIHSPGRPAFPPRSLLCDGQSLASFIGPRSWLLFSLLDASGRWLQLHTSTWRFGVRPSAGYARMVIVVT